MHFNRIGILMVKHSCVSNFIAESPQPFNASFIIFYNFTSYLQLARIQKSR